jgi:hypothetical protein
MIAKWENFDFWVKLHLILKVDNPQNIHQTLGWKHAYNSIRSYMVTIGILYQQSNINSNYETLMFIIVRLWLFMN